MSISVNCPGCANSFRVADAKLGRKIKCPVCGEAFLVSEEDDDLKDSQSFRSPGRGKRGRKSKGKSNELAVPIGIAVGVVVVLVVGFGLARMRSAPMAAPNEQTTSIPTASPNNTATEPGPTIASVPRNTEPAPSSKTNKPADEEDTTPPKPDANKEMDDFFNTGGIPELRIQIAEPEMEVLNKCARSFVIGDERPSVEGNLTENGQTKYKYVSIKLKGSAGSYRPVDDRPALSINIAKSEKDQTFHGMKKFHLNNSVQDPTYLHEWVCEQLFHAAKLPATRVE
jgi:predicted Zn finger-like uncharacterized protein